MNPTLSTLIALTALGCGNKKSEPEAATGPAATVTVSGGKVKLTGNETYEVNALVKVTNKGSSNITVNDVDYKIWLADVDCDESKKIDSFTVASGENHDVGVSATHEWHGEGGFPWKQAKVQGQVKWTDSSGGSHTTTFEEQRDLEMESSGATAVKQ